MNKKDFENFFPSEKEIPEKFKVKEINQNAYLIDGELRIWKGETQKVYSPVCVQKNGKSEQVFLGTYPMLGEKETLEALDSAVKAYDRGMGEWAKMKIEDRIEHFKNFIVRMREKREEIVKLLMWEIGKTLPDSEKEFDRTVEYIESTIQSLKTLDRDSSRFIFEGGIFAQVRRAPLGVVLCMGPFNYPLNETFTTLIPALMMGNTIVFKPAKFGVLLLAPLLEAFQKSFPKGVVNTIYGDGKTVVTPIMASGKVDVFAFIGSAGVSNVIEKQHPKPNRLKSVLGLGAKNPAIILADADLELTVKECVLGSLSYNGQRCTALKIIFVHKSIADVFVEKFSKAVSSLKGGMPWEEGVKITPLPETDKTKYMNDYINDAVKNGAKVVNENGGEIIDTFFYPAAVYPVNEKMRLYREEQFGPVVPIVTFDSIEEPINYMITSDVGQQASVFGNNSEEIALLVDTLVNQVCRVNINSQCQRGPDEFPFTGRKDSAEGTLSVSDALRVFSIRTLVAAKENEINKSLVGKIIKDRKSNFLSTDFIL